MKKNYLLMLLFLVTSTLTAQLVLNETLYDPATSGLDGDANRDGANNYLDDEFVEFVNAGVAPLDISGYKIYDNNRFDDLPSTDDPRHIVPANTIISAGGIYVVFGGSVNDEDSDLSTIRAAFPAVIFHLASSGVLDLQNSGDGLHMLEDGVTDPASDILAFDPNALFLYAGDDQSLARLPSITGSFQHHGGINGNRFSPGELQTSAYTNTLPLILNEALFDPSEDADGNGDLDFLRDEFLEFVNNSGSSVDISGYKIYDGRRFVDNGLPRHTVLPNTIIPNEGVFLLFGGDIFNGTFGNSIVQTANIDGTAVAGDDTAQLNLSNSGDTIIITDASDNVVFVFDSTAFGIDMGNNQSATRSPDVTGNFIGHTDTSSGAIFSPGTKSDGSRLSTDSFQLAFEKLRIYKTNSATLKVEGLIQGKVSVKLFNIIGKQILNKSFNTNGSEEIMLPKINTGIYIFQIETPQGNLDKKIILK